MNKQKREAIEKAVVDYDGVWNHAIADCLRKGISEAEFEQVKAEMQNNPEYQYGVEYECNGVKPDLPDDVLVDIRYVSGEWRGEPEPVSCWNWRVDFSNADISAFRIVDERYNPKSNWHERGELPPVGVECKVIRSDWGVWEKCEILFVGSQTVVFKSESRVECACELEHVEFRPLPTKRDETIAAAESAIESKTGEPANSTHLGILYDAGLLRVKDDGEG